VSAEPQVGQTSVVGVFIDAVELDK